ncbi:membrane protein [Frondihabitans sucicola]|uniref:Membrane protein n=1 Tax=Frondihabitans sucicola TaxID=1268041 RepID=A0ABM8GUT7_9MICO|nr:general stress protein [Frondihabitans sucicola]BDZ52201.1 membrane protein [Frondihabitans sucicola]
MSNETPNGEPEPTKRPDRPAYGEYAPAGSQQPTAPAAQPAESTGSAAESLGGVGAFVGGSYPQVVATFTKYEDAQKAVDHLSDEGFPVENVSIVGHDIRTVENVSGRLTNGRAASRGLISGIWFGLAIGLLLGFFVPGVNWIGVVIGGIVFGAIWGALFGFLGHAATRGQRDFASVKTMEAGRYEVLVRGEFATKATQLLNESVYK